MVEEDIIMVLLWIFGELVFYDFSNMVLDYVDYLVKSWIGG